MTNRTILRLPDNDKSGNRHRPLSKGPFADAAPIYMDAGLFPLPCNDKAANCIKWGTMRHPPGPDLVKKFSDKNIGVATGSRSDVFIVDVDDAGDVDAMLARFGDTPIVTATPSGGGHLWYRWTDEGCGTLRPEFPVDLKGEGGFVVCPPSIRREGEHQGKAYRFIRGGLEDLDQLPTIRPGSFPQRDAKAARAAPKNAPRPASKAHEDSRNVELFHAVKEAAANRNADSLAAFAHRYNVTEFADPLSAVDVDWVVKSVLKYKADGKLLLKGCEPSIILTKSQIDARMADPYGFVMWVKLRVEHEPRPGPFAVDRRTLAPVLGWAPGTVDSTRKRLEATGDLKLTGKGKATQLPDGTWRKPPNLYDINRGPNYVPNTILQSCRAVPPSDRPHFQGDLFGGDFANVVSLDSWRRGVMPMDIRRATKVKMRCEGLTQDALAARVGLSRPQLTNGLLGRFGFGPEATARLKAFLAAA